MVLELAHAKPLSSTTDHILAGGGDAAGLLHAISSDPGAGEEITNDKPWPRAGST